MVEDLKARGLAVQSEGAWVVPVAEESDKKEIPPMILVKSDGSAIYATTDLATMVQRMHDWNPDKILYLTDKRQSLHFEQVFRAARKSGIVAETTELEHIGFGTMNGKDGKPFKTREGGVGGPHKRRNMWFNSMIREEPYPGLKVSDGSGNRSSLRGTKLGAAWLSSARAVRCRVKSHNERNPC